MRAIAGSATPDCIAPSKRQPSCTTSSRLPRWCRRPGFRRHWTKERGHVKRGSDGRGNVGLRWRERLGVATPSPAHLTDKHTHGCTRDKYADHQDNCRPPHIRAFRAIWDFIGACSRSGRHYCLRPMACSRSLAGDRCKPLAGNSVPLDAARRSVKGHGGQCITAVIANGLINHWPVCRYQVPVSH